MEKLTQLFNAQKEQIEKDLKQIDDDEWKLKVQRSKLSKMLKQVNKQLETAADEKEK